ncbi:AraC family transcriptional regulator [Rhodopseudomonas palustris]|uniref:AraC family transcriptional regulator n=1 Tax=Rhodopseudomonas palustris TaxID=1076 RepID=A0A418V1V9_RHOPL|nr:AraC family transcriptional regulator [Rhodopseudomonas palustris]RJF69947.1 AraC family transcriptional regulator [Rhodopseudomonas palustris]
MGAPRVEDKVDYRRLAQLDELEFVYATYATHQFAKHSHETFSIGLVERGANTFLHRGEKRIAPAGCICAVNPGEIHTGDPGSDGWTYWNFFPSAETLTRVAEDLYDRPMQLPELHSSVIDDVVAAGLLRRMFASFMRPTSRLECETNLVETLAWLVRHHTDLTGPQTAKPLPGAILRSIDYLNSCSDQNVSLDHLAEMSGISRFHFLRSFSAATGLPPHAYQVQLRLARARNMLREGQPIAEVAITVGFADQAHLSRLFKRSYGVSPGRWIAAGQ